MPKQSEAPKGKRFIQTAIDKGVADRLEAHARRNDRLLAAEIRIAIREYLERIESNGVQE